MKKLNKNAHYIGLFFSLVLLGVLVSAVLHTVGNGTPFMLSFAINFFLMGPIISGPIGFFVYFIRKENEKNE